MHDSQVARRAFSIFVAGWFRKSNLAQLCQEKGGESTGSKKTLVQECLRLYTPAELMKRSNFIQSLTWYSRLVIASLLPGEKSIQGIVSELTNSQLTLRVLAQVLSPTAFEPPIDPSETRRLLSMTKSKGYLARPVYKLRKKGIILLNRSTRTYYVNPLVEDYFNEEFGSNADKLFQDIEENSLKVGAYKRAISDLTRRRSDLSSVHGIGPIREKELENLGINNTRMFTMKSAEELHQEWRQLTRYAPSFTEICQMQIHIESLKKRKSIYFGSIGFPIGHEVLVLDLEYDHFICVWLVGLLASNTVGTECYQLFADELNEEKENLVRFATLLDRYPAHQILTWDGLRADLPQLEEAWHRHRLPPEEMEGLRQRHLDLYNLILGNYRFPLASFGLKEVGGYLGFKRKHEDMDGLEAQMLYHQYLNMPKNNIRQRSNIKKTLLEYNREDLEATLFAVSKLRSLANGD